MSDKIDGVSSEIFQNLAEELSKVGDNYGAAVILFAASLHVSNDKEGMRLYAEYGKRFRPGEVIQQSHGREN